jgi:hypothetical protein
VDHHRGTFGKLGDSVDCELQGRIGIRIDFFVKADVSVADLDECEPIRRRSVRFTETQRTWHSTRDRPDYPRSRPRQAFHKSAPAYTCILRVHVSAPVATSAATGTKSAVGLFQDSRWQSSENFYGNKLADFSVIEFKKMIGLFRTVSVIGPR